MATETVTRETVTQAPGRDWEALYRAYGRQPAAYLVPEPQPFDADEEEMEGCDYGPWLWPCFVRDGGW